MKNKFLKIFILSFVLTSILWIPYIFCYFSNVDEPGYFSSALHLAKGKLLYKDVFEAKGPGIMFIFTFFVKFFYKNPTFFLHIFMFLILIFNSFLIFKILNKKIPSNFSIIGFFFPVFLSCFYPVDMITGPEIFVSFIILLTFFIFFYFLDKKLTIFFVGFLSGLILLFKPFGILYILCFLILIFLETKRFGKISIFLSGIFLTCISFLLYLCLNNLIYDFHLWTIEYPVFVSKTIPLIKKIYFFFPMISRIFLLNPFYIIFGLPLIFKKEEFKKNFEFILLFIISLLWGASHGLAFPHHYMISIPFIFMISIIGFYKFNEEFLKNYFKVKKVLNLFIIFSILQSLIYWNGFDFYKKWISFIKEKKWTRQYEEKQLSEILNFLRENVKNGDKIVIWGLNPKIYFLGEFISGTRFISSVEPVNGIVYYDVSKIIQFKKVEEIFIEEIKKKDVKFIIDATEISLIGIPYYTFDKYPLIEKVVNEEYEQLTRIYNGCKIYRRIL